VLPSQKLSHQSHEKRQELWMIVQGTRVMTLDDRSYPVLKCETVIIEIGQKYRIENTGDVNLVFIEIQTGTYFGEDDIVWFEDNYGRT